jgi:hypothetical protein
VAELTPTGNAVRNLQIKWIPWLMSLYGLSCVMSGCESPYWQQIDGIFVVAMRLRLRRHSLE